MTICDIDWCVSSLGFCLTNFFKAHGNKSWYLRDETCIWEMGAEDIETFQQVSLSTCAWYDYIVTICHLHQWQLITSFHVRRVPSTFRPSRDKRFKMPWSFLVLPSTKVLESLTSGRHRAHRHGSMAAKQRSHGKLRLQGRRLKKNLKLEMLSTSLYMYCSFVFWFLILVPCPRQLSISSLRFHKKSCFNRWKWMNLRNIDMMKYIEIPKNKWNERSLQDARKV